MLRAGPRESRASDSGAVTWSMMTDTGGDLQCSSNLNDSLNRLSPPEKIHYTMNGYSYTTKKVDPYTAIQTNNITKQQKTLKSSVCTQFDYLFVCLKGLNVTLMLICCVICYFVCVFFVFFWYVNVNIMQKNKKTKKYKIKLGLG